jgi:hypothetical protein
MRTKEASQNVALATAATAGTAALATMFAGGWLKSAEKLVIDATLVGPTGGTLDVCLQRKLGTNKWKDWIRFPQVAAAATKHYVATVNGEGAAITECGNSTDASPAMTIVANTIINMIPNEIVRVVVTTGAGTSVAGSVDVTITPYSERH